MLHLAEACASTADTDIPDEMLAKQPKEWVSQAFILLSQKFFRLIKEFDLEEKIDDWYIPNIPETEEIEDVVESDG